MDDNPQNQLLIIAILSWAIPIISIFVASFFSPLHITASIIISAILGCLVIEFSIKKTSLEYKDKVLAGLAMTAITLFQFSGYSLTLYYHQGILFIILKLISTFFLFGMPIIIFLILIKSFKTHSRKYTKQNLQSVLTFLLAAFFFAVPIFLAINYFLMPLC